MSRNDLSIRRRSLLAGSAAALGGSALFGTNTRSALATTQAAGTEPKTPDGTIEPMEFWFAGGLIGADGEPLTNDELVAVRAEDSAELRPRLNDPTVGYPDDTPIPMVAIDERNVEGTVVGLGSLLVRRGTNWEYGNEEFLLNLLDYATEETNGRQTVLFHEASERYRNVEDDSNPSKVTGVAPYYTLDRFETFVEYAAVNGYEFVADTEIGGNTPGPSPFVAALQAEDPAAVVIPASREFPRENIVALQQYVATGGTVLLHDQSDLACEYFDDKENASDNNDATRPLNRTADTLGVGFRFNNVVVRDNIRNRKGPAQLLTSQFNTDTFPELFEDRPGLDPDEERYSYILDVTDYVKDGDTIYLDFGFTQEASSAFEVRMLGLDATESGDNACFERPEEWPGLAAENEDYIGRDGSGSSLHLPDACSLRFPTGGSAPETTALRAEPTARQETSGEGGGPPGFVDHEGSPPVAAATDRVVALGAPLVDDPALSGENRNADFLLNLWDDRLGGGAMVVYDEGHGQQRSLDDFGTFLDTKPGHYTVESTDDLTGFLTEKEPDAVWLTAPTEAFDEAETEALAAFVDGGGVVFAHGEAADEESGPVERLNAVVEALDAPVRFNLDRVVDPEQNAGSESRPKTANLPGQSSTDGLDNRYDNIRWANDANYGNRCDQNYPRLRSWAGKATDYLAYRLKNPDGTMKTVEFEPDPNSILDGLGRALGYVYYDSTGDGTYDRNVNLELVEEGLARAYDSGHSKHDEFLAAELRARAEDREMWAESDPEATRERRNRPVERVFVPQATSVRTEDGSLPANRAPVTAEPTASQDGAPAVSYNGEIPLVGLDESANTAVVGGTVLEEAYEIREDDFRGISFVNDTKPFRVNTAAFDHYAFVTNLLDSLADDVGGPILVESGHGQFAAPSDEFGGKVAQSAEEAAYLQRFLEGVDGTQLHGLNDLGSNLNGDLVDAQALIICSPMRPYSEPELAAVKEFADRGSAVVLMGSGRAPAAARENLNDIAAAIGTDLRVNDDRVVDSEHAVRGVEDLVYTGRLDESFDLYGRARAAPDTGPPRSPRSGSEGPEELEVSGSRAGSSPEVVTGGERVRVELTIGNVTHPIELRDELDTQVRRDWEVIDDLGDIEAYEEARGFVSLGRVTPEDVQGDDTVTKTYFLETPKGADLDSTVPSDTGFKTYDAGYTVGSAVGVAIIDGQLKTYRFAGETTYRWVPFDPSDPLGSIPDLP